MIVHRLPSKVCQDVSLHSPRPYIRISDHHGIWGSVIGLEREVHTFISLSSDPGKSAPFNFRNLHTIQFPSIVHGSYDQTRVLSRSNERISGAAVPGEHCFFRATPHRRSRFQVKRLVGHGCPSAHRGDHEVSPISTQRGGCSRVRHQQGEQLPTIASGDGAVAFGRSVCRQDNSLPVPSQHAAPWGTRRA